MGLFSSKKNGIPEGWTPLTQENQIAAIINASHEKPQVFFKDSTSCGISANIKHRLVEDWSSLAEEMDLHYLDLLSYRDISNKIAQVSGVPHQSPQVIIYHKGEVIADTSHFAITIKFLEDLLAN